MSKDALALAILIVIEIVFRSANCSQINSSLAGGRLKTFTSLNKAHM